MEQREVEWCNVHDIPWASHAELGVTLSGCEKGSRFMVTNVDVSEVKEAVEIAQQASMPKPVHELSTSGHWARGQIYQPTSGDCAGHPVEVINPRLPALRQVTFERDDEKRTLTGLIECVQVRCTKCFRSWRFPAVAVLPQALDDPLDEEYRTSLAQRIFDEIMGNGGEERLA